MPTINYRNHQGLDASRDHINVQAPTAVRLENLLAGRVRGAYVKRPGSKQYDIQGGVFGLGGYQEQDATKAVSTVTPIRVRVASSTFYIEKLSLTSDSWTSITVDSNLSTGFDNVQIASFCQQSEALIMACDRVGMLTSIGGNFNRCGGPGPTAAPTLGTTSGSLTGDYNYVYTFYDSTTGWESSPSPIGSVSPSGQDVTVSSLETTAYRAGVDKKRIYRTIDGGSVYLYHSEITLATTGFTDSTTDGNLGTAVAPDTGDHEPPPDGAYICKLFKNRLWVAVGDTLYYSDAFDGNTYRLEYFNLLTRYFQFPQRITGLCPTPDFGRLLVFTPPGDGIHEILPLADGSFSSEVYLQGEGTKFHSSIATNGQSITWWGAGYPRLYNQRGLVEDYSERVENLIRPLVSREFNEEMFVWSAWNEAVQQYLYGVGLVSGATSVWVKAGTLSSANWVDVDTGARVDWEVQA